MALHAWWNTFGTEVSDIAELSPPLARELASLVASDALGVVRLIGLRQSPEAGYAGVCVEIEVERPQDLAASIKALEPVAVIFPFDGGQPSVLSMRDDFPDTPHQNWAPPGGPYALCIDDRPWQEARLTTSAYEIARRTQLWLAKAARGELHDSAQPPEPFFFRSTLGLVLPAAAFAESREPIELVGFVRDDNPNLIVSQRADVAGSRPPLLVVLAFQAQPQAMSRLRHAPDTLSTLSAELEKCGIRLIDELRARLKAWAGLEGTDVNRLSARLAIVIAFPPAEGARHSVADFRAFLTYDAAGAIGVELGILYANNSSVGDRRAYLAAIPEGVPTAQELRVEPAQVFAALDREFAAVVAGNASPDLRRAVLVGAGSLGSQLSVDLAREGVFAWTVVDDDHLLPHNFVRHALFANDVGAPKAVSLARNLSGLLGEPVRALQCNAITPGDDASAELGAALTQADVIIDASASVAVSRHLSDLSAVGGRRVSAFFNPAGDAVVVLAEAGDRSVTLPDLEAQYLRLVLTEPGLADHLATSGAGVRYTGSCRALTNRIPAGNAAILSALAARGVRSALAAEEASICIWVLNGVGEVRRIHRRAAPVTHATLGGWRVAYDADLVESIADMRRRKLPKETGGVLLGIADMSRKSVHIAHLLPEPADSRASPSGFERGVANLAEQVKAAAAMTMHQLRYVGEWHSHPDSVSSMPSALDLEQLLWLGEKLEGEGLPGLIAIAGEDGGLTLALTRIAQKTR